MVSQSVAAKIIAMGAVRHPARVKKGFDTFTGLALFANDILRLDEDRVGGENEFRPIRKNRHFSDDRIGLAAVPSNFPFAADVEAKQGRAFVLGKLFRLGLILLADKAASP
jgi:hypothetical protein